MSIELVVTLQGRVLARSSFGQPLVRMGRSPENEVFVDNLAFSRFHATIRRTEGGLHVLEDLRTPNGTFVNGKRVQHWNLSNGDRIAIGKFVIEFRSHVIIRSPAPLRIDGANTLAVDFRVIPESAEESWPVRGQLVVATGERLELARDAFVVGSDRSSDLVVRGWLVPKKIALIARGLTGFSVVNLTGADWVRMDGRPVPWQAPLAPGSMLGFGRVEARFALVESERRIPCPT